MHCVVNRTRHLKKSKVSLKGKEIRKCQQLKCIAFKYHSTTTFLNVKACSSWCASPANSSQTSEACKSGLPQDSCCKSQPNRSARNMKNSNMYGGTTHHVPPTMDQWEIFQDIRTSQVLLILICHLHLFSINQSHSDLQKGPANFQDLHLTTLCPPGHERQLNR